MNMQGIRAEVLLFDQLIIMMRADKLLQTLGNTGVSACLISDSWLNSLFRTTATKTQIAQVWLLGATNMMKRKQVSFYTSYVILLVSWCLDKLLQVIYSILKWNEKCVCFCVKCSSSPERAALWLCSVCKKELQARTGLGNVQNVSRRLPALCVVLKTVDCV